MAKVNDGSTSYHDLSFLDAAGADVVPEAIRYRLMASETYELIPWTALPLDCRSIKIAAGLNTILNGGNRRYLSVEVTHNGGDKITAELGYFIVDLKGIS